MILRLSGEQYRLLTEMLSENFTIPELEQLVTFEFGKDFDDVVRANSTKPGAAFQIIGYANRHRLLPALVRGAHAINPSLPRFAEFFDRAGATPIIDKPQLERIVRSSTDFQDPVAFRSRLSRIETQVCRIEYPSGGGTGFLVGPDLALTNFHVMEPVFRGQISPSDVVFRFDYKRASDDTMLLDGVEVRLAANWRIHDRPPSPADTQPGTALIQPEELDYALIRLERPIGGENIGGIGPKRGWLLVPSQPSPVAAETPILLVQYPGSLRLQLAIGSVLAYAANGLRIHHSAATIGGSSGSPCFDVNWRLFAIHHAGDPDFDGDHVPAYNQAIPIRAIVATLASHGVEPFWDRTCAL